MKTTETVNVPSVLEQKLFGTPITRDIKLSRAELRTVFYIGRKLELIQCLLPMQAPKPRTIREHKSYGFVMDTGETERPTSYLRFETGDVVIGESSGIGFVNIRIENAAGEVAAKYRLL